MKRVLAISLLLLLTAGVGAFSVSKADRAAITDVIEKFKESGDRQDPGLADQSLHKDFVLVYLGADGLVRSSKDEYKEALRQKKIGGEKRGIRIEDLTVADNVASAHVLFKGQHADFTNFINLAKVDGNWKIVHIALRFEPKKS